jgi:hypothetical protein
MIGRFGGALALCLMLAVPAAAQESGRIVEPDQERIAGGSFEVMVTRLRGRFEREQFGGIGQTIHYGHDMEYDKYDIGYEAEAWVWISRLWRLEGRWFGTTHEDEHGDVRRFLLHDGEVYAPGERIRSEVELNIVSFGARATFGGGDTRFSIPFGLLYTNHKLTLDSRDTDAQGTERIEAWSPYVGFGVETQFNDIVGLQAEVRAFAYAGGHVDRFGYFEAEANLTFSFLEGRLRARTGPKVIAQDYHAEFSNDNDKTSDFTVTAWQAGVVLEF